MLPNCAENMDAKPSYRFVPIRCFTCGMPIANKLQTFDGAECEPAESFRRLAVERRCCRAVLLTSAEDTQQVTRLDASTLRPAYVANMQFSTSLNCPEYRLSADGSTAVLEP